MATVPLSGLEKGERAVVRRIGPTEARIALMNMGLMPGDLVEVTDMAPRGCPIAIKARGTKIALRRSLAEQIEVERPAVHP